MKRCQAARSRGPSDNDRPEVVSRASERDRVVLPRLHLPVLPRLHAGRDRGLPEPARPGHRGGPGHPEPPRERAPVLSPRPRALPGGVRSRQAALRGVRAGRPGRARRHARGRGELRGVVHHRRHRPPAPRRLARCGESQFPPAAPPSRASTALEQGLFLIDRGGTIRHRAVIGPLEPIPAGPELVALARAHAAHGQPAA